MLLVQKQSVTLCSSLGFLSLAYSAFSPTDTSDACTVTLFFVQSQQALALYWCKEYCAFFSCCTFEFCCLQFHNLINSVTGFFFQQVYDEIEICPLNIYHIHLTKTENISDFGKISEISVFILLIPYFLSSGLFCLWEQVEAYLIAQSLSLARLCIIMQRPQKGHKLISYAWEASTF